MPAVQVGSGTTVAVLLHQTSGDGLCGWWPYADRLARRYHLRAVLFDLCGYGKSDCPDPAFAEDQLAQVAVAVNWARGHGARRVVIVGASMGGSIALDATRSTHADAVVDLSGPVMWGPLNSVHTMSKLTVPTLIAISPSVDPADFDALKAAFPSMPAKRKLFLAIDSHYHGWGMLRDPSEHWTVLADQVAMWIKGPAIASGA